MRHKLESYFEFNRLGTNWRTEALAGVTTFVTMAYIIFVNPRNKRGADDRFLSSVPMAENRPPKPMKNLTELATSRPAA
jgi:hypothetical protein